MKKEILYYQMLNIGIKVKKIKDIDIKLDKIIEKYYGRNIYFNPYLNSKNRLVRMIIEGEFPTVEEWNKIAEEEGYLSHISLEYIGECNWKELKIKLIKEIKQILLE
ncbi:MAG: hypothetical protein HFJ58_06150 [Clostridia bacterium]|nr:hypothetical protein [Clostridia bacterium]